MEKYQIINISDLKTNTINILYSKLLQQKYNFLLLHINAKKYVLTKEKSIFEITDEKKFINHFNNNIYYKTIVKKDNINVDLKYLNIYKNYITDFKNQLTNKKYDNKYYFGCVAVKAPNGILTTIRGKENLEEYTLIKNVDHINHKIYVINKKATLNVPLLDYLFNNTNAKAIVHLHEFDNNFPYYEYAFPGPVKDSIRNSKTSFNIKHHGIIYLFDENKNIL